MDHELLDAIRAVVREEVEPIRIDMGNMKADIEALKIGQTELQTDVSAIKLTLENDIPRQLNLLSEGHAGLADKLSRIDDMANDIEELKGAIVAVEALAVQHQK